MVHQVQDLALDLQDLDSALNLVQVQGLVPVHHQVQDLALVVPQVQDLAPVVLQVQDLAPTVLRVQDLALGLDLVQDLEVLHFVGPQVHHLALGPPVPLDLHIMDHQVHHLDPQVLKDPHFHLVNQCPPTFLL